MILRIVLCGTLLKTQKKEKEKEFLGETFGKCCKYFSLGYL